MSIVAPSQANHDDGGAFSPGAEPAEFQPATRAAIFACLQKRRDVAPVAPENWSSVLDESTLEWTGFAMATAQLKFRVATSHALRGKLFRAHKRVHWVFVGDSDAEFPNRPLSCHSSLAFAAEMLMIFYAGLCGL